MDYYEKYVKYKLKYLELKALHGGNDLIKVNTTIKKLLEEIVDGLIIPIIIELECCLSDLNIVDTTNMYQKKYLDKFRTLFREYYIKLLKIIKNITNSERKNMRKNLMEHIDKMDIYNLIDIISKYIWPILESFLIEYDLMISALIDFIDKEKLPNYQISSLYKRTDRGATCEILNSRQKASPNQKQIQKRCCDVILKAKDCVYVLGSQRLPRINLLLIELRKQIEKGKDIIKDIKIYNKIHYDLGTKIDTVSRYLKQINDKIGKGGKLDELTNKFISKIKSEVESESKKGITGKISLLTSSIDKLVENKIKNIYGSLEIKK